MTKPKFLPSSDESELFPADADPATSASTRATFLGRGGADYTKVRNTLIQMPASGARGSSQPSTLGQFSRNHRALILYLALLTNWTWLERSGEARSAETWIRFLQSDKKGALTWTPQTLSHAWLVLEEKGLVLRTLKQRMKLSTPYREDGKRVPYTAPRGADGDSYFVLPHAFWTEEHHATLTWPELATLLILLKETGAEPSHELPVDRAERYYGISRTTAEKGLLGLRKKDLVVSRNRWIKDDDAGEGRRQTTLHAPVDVYSRTNRKALQEAARTRVTSRSNRGEVADHGDQEGREAPE